MDSMLERNGKKVCVMGLGYIGLPTAAILASRGYDVHGVDVRADVVETINRGEIHIHEPRLAELVKEVVDGGNLHASIEPCEADVFFICVPTPSNSDKSPDLSYVRAASEAIRPYVRRGNIIILESTSPPKTTEETVVPLAVANEFEVGRDVFVAYCPERVLPGRILIEAVENDRIVGGITPACTQHVQQFYETFVTGNVLATTAITAEITKLTENAFRDVNIAFANELSMLADHLGADAFEIIELANRHPRVNILNPGPGVGGHCISVDPWFLAHAAPNQTPLIRAARQVNDHKPHFLVQKIERLVADYRISVVGCLGLAYKADVDDLRESPSLEIVRELKSRLNAEILVCDPYVSPDKFREFSLCPLDEIVQRSELLVLLTDHSQFMTLSSKQLSNKLLIDARGEWHSQDLTAAAQRDVPLATPAASERHAA